jgi:heme exporter protein A
VKAVLTVRENIAVWVGEAGPPAMTPEEALATFGLMPLAEQPARLLSAGQRRRLALARLLACGGDIWLLDEPGVGLDHGSQERLEAAIADHRTAGGRVVLASHTAIELPEASRLDLADYQPDSLPELIW